MNRMKKIVTAVASVALAGGLGLGLVTPAAADGQDTASVNGASVSALNESGYPVAAIEGSTVFTLKGSDFQAIKNGAGGIYVVFGWVSDTDGLTWTPSNGGQTGDNYRYVPDAEDETNQGHSRYIAFEGSKTAAAANGGFIAEDGSWETELAVPGAQFESFDRDGNPAQVDCLEVTCGVITFGAHNVKNANNETFTPVTFVEDSSVDPAGSPEPADTATQDPIADESAQPSESASDPADTQTQEPEASATDSSPSSEAESGNGTNSLIWIIAGVVVVLAGATVAIRGRTRRKIAENLQ